MTILDLLAEAGGPSTSALQDRILVVNRARREEQATRFDLEKFAESGDPSLLPLLQPGDTVYVPGREQSAWFDIMGSVKDIVMILSMVKLASDI